MRSDAPVRIADVGGWTDTWFGAPGRVCHLAVGPGVTVHAGLHDRPGSAGSMVVRVEAPDVGAAGVVEADPDEGWVRPRSAIDPLLAHAVAAVLDGVEPSAGEIRLSIGSGVPAGASMGTSGSVIVAVQAALDRLVGGGRRGPDELARLAHRTETDRAGREAGVQDQWAAAHGGSQLLSIGPYPDVARTPISLGATLRAELDSRTVTVVFGPHDSSEVHGDVIHDVLTCDGVGHDRTRRALRELSALAGEAADALAGADVDRWARALTRSTEAQGRLHPGLVGVRHAEAIEIARAHGASGWKVNGAGGAGGSLSIVTRGPSSKPALVAALEGADPTWQVLDLSHGVTGVATTVLA